MNTVEVSQSALESLQKMVEQLQERNEELLRAVCRARDWHHGDPWRNGSDQEYEAWSQHNDMLETIIAKCTAKPEVLE